MMSKKIVSEGEDNNQLKGEIINLKLVNQKLMRDLLIANRELTFQNEEKRKRSTELGIAYKELIFQDKEKEKRANELGIANIELEFQNDEKEKRANELGIANQELAFQNNEKEKRAAELFIANKELIFQTSEKEKRAAELVIADIELDFQYKEKEKREIVNKELEVFNYNIKLASQYSLSLIEASRDPLFTISPAGKITDLNQATVRVTGVPREKLINTNFIDYFTEPTKASEGYKQVFKNGFVVDYPLTMMDHKLTDVLFNGSVYKDDKGNVVGAVVVARDITEQKRIEKELTEAKVFAEFATELAEVAKGKAEDAVKSKQQFLSNMSHEIRTPMYAIIGFTKVVLKTELTEKQREYLDAIKISGDALIVLINDILDLAKVDAGKMSFEKTPFKMASSISSMLHLFEIKIQEKNLQLIKKYDKNIPEILIEDPIRLHQIILNLVSNALKFTNTGSITVEAVLLKQNDEKVIIEFSVKDTGIGIAEYKLGKIFENFQQASSGTSRIYGGTGLGLAIVKQLVESQGGTINVVSEIMEGSTFKFSLEFQKTHEVALKEIDQLEISNLNKNIKVLVVEDIALNQLLMKTLLDDFGFERDIASNGKIAIEKLNENFYDVILMDLQMPEMNGFEATEYIRNEMHSDIPIIALTADVTTVDLAKCTAVGMNDYIAKPVDERLLYNKIISIVKTTNYKSVVSERELIAEPNYTDLSYLIKKTKASSEIMLEMISLYLEQTPLLITSMKDSLVKKDWDLLNVAIHKLIPSFLIVGIDNKYEVMARKVQCYSKALLKSDELYELVAQLDKVCTQACKELKVESDRLKLLL